MSSEVKIRSTEFMESQNEKKILQARIREVEDENQELRTQSLLQNRTITDLRNELMLLRVQMSELADTSALLRERVRTLVQNSQSRQQQESEGNAGPVTAPPLMAPPPVPPPMPPPRIRISPRQVGAGEALTTPLGVSLSSPPRQRIKRDTRQGFYKTSRAPYRRSDGSEPGPSSQTAFYNPERPNYFVGLKIIPQFQSFLCPGAQATFSDSASDSSGSDENLQVSKKSKLRPSDGEAPFKSPSHYSKNFEIMKNVRNLHHQNVRQSILQNYNFPLPNNKKFFFPLPWERKGRENPAQPSTSGNEVGYFQGASSGASDRVPGGSPGAKSALKVSDCVQYTFPTIHEGLHHGGLNSMMGTTTPPSRMRKYKKNIPYLPQESRAPEEGAKDEDDGEEAKFGRNRKSPVKSQDLESESLSSTEEMRAPRASTRRELPSDFEQDGFQGDESSNCLTSTDNSLEHINVTESKTKKTN